MQHAHDMYIECPHEKDNKNRMKLRKKSVEFLSSMMRTERNPPMRIEGEGVVLGYDHIASYINSNKRVIKVN